MGGRGYERSPRIACLSSDTTTGGLNYDIRVNVDNMDRVGYKGHPGILIRLIVVKSLYHKEDIPYRGSSGIDWELSLLPGYSILSLWDNVQWYLLNK